MTTVSEEEKEGSAPSIPQDPEIKAQSRAYARKRVSRPSLTSPDPATGRGQALRLAAVRAAAFLDRPGSLAHAHPHSFARARERHHEAASRHTLWTPLRIGRLAWGYFHLIFIKPLLNFIEWWTSAPLTFFGLSLLGLVIWIWS